MRGVNEVQELERGARRALTGLQFRPEDPFNKATPILVPVFDRAEVLERVLDSIANAHGGTDALIVVS